MKLTAESGDMLFVPVGFAHGFCTLEDDTHVSYKVDRYYSPQHDAGIRIEPTMLGPTDDHRTGLT